VLQCSALQSASRSLSVCLSVFFLLLRCRFVVAIDRRSSRKQLLLLFVSSVQVKVRHLPSSLPPSLEIAMKAELPAQELLSFCSVFSTLFCFCFSCRINKKRTKNKKLLQLSSFQVISLFAKPIFVCHVFSSVVCMSRYRDFILPNCC